MNKTNSNLFKKKLKNAIKKLSSYEFKETKELIEEKKVKVIIIIPLSGDISKSILEELIETINRDLLLVSLNISAFPYFLPIETIKLPKSEPQKYELHQAIHKKLKDAPIIIDGAVIYGIYSSRDSSHQNIPFAYEDRIKALVCKDIKRRKEWIQNVASSICSDIAWTCGIAGYIPIFTLPKKQTYDFINKKYKELVKDLAIRLTIDDIDSFSKVKRIKAQDVVGLVPIKMREKEIKAAIGAIIGEAFIAKDWGGEKSDLFTIHLKYKTRSLRAAFLLKGWRGVKGTLTLDKIGKRSDQIVRLYTEPADIYILQYSSNIDSAVYDQMETFAKGKQKKYYCILDGTETARLLKAYNKLK